MKYIICNKTWSKTVFGIWHHFVCTILWIVAIWTNFSLAVQLTWVSSFSIDWIQSFSSNFLQIYLLARAGGVWASVLWVVQLYNICTSIQLYSCTMCTKMCTLVHIVLLYILYNVYSVHTVYLYSSVYIVYKVVHIPYWKVYKQYSTENGINFLSAIGNQ